VTQRAAAEALGDTPRERLLEAAIDHFGRHGI
jgi:hypothetical protein